METIYCFIEIILQERNNLECPSITCQIPAMKNRSKFMKFQRTFCMFKIIWKSFIQWFFYCFVLCFFLNLKI